MLENVIVSLYQPFSGVIKMQRNLEIFISMESLGLVLCQ